MGRRVGKYDPRDVKRVLLDIGFKQMPGHRGHELWQDEQGRRVNPPARASYSENEISILGKLLASYGICEAREFVRRVKNVPCPSAPTDRPKARYNKVRRQSAKSEPLPPGWDGAYSTSRGGVTIGDILQGREEK